MFHYNNHLIFNEKGLEDNQRNDSGLGLFTKEQLELQGTSIDKSWYHSEQP